MSIRTVLFAVAMATAGAANAQNSGPKVAIIPIQHMSGEKWEELRNNQVAKGMEHLREEFTKRNFNLIPDTAVSAAIQELKIDLTDEEQHRRAVLLDIANKVNADFIYFGVITHTSQHMTNNLLSQKRRGLTTVKMWFLDVKNGKAILSAKSVQGESSSGTLGGTWGKGSDRQIQATANAIRDGLADFFKEYPVKSQFEALCFLARFASVRQ
jgi:hypothetical protein